MITRPCYLKGSPGRWSLSVVTYVSLVSTTALGLAEPSHTLSLQDIRDRLVQSRARITTVDASIAWDGGPNSMQMIIDDLGRYRTTYTDVSDGTTIELMYDGRFSIESERGSRRSLLSIRDGFKPSVVSLKLQTPLTMSIDYAVALLEKARKYEWTATVTANDGLVELSLADPETGQATAQLVFDKTQGLLPTQIRTFREGRVEMLMRSAFEMTNGVWFPVAGKLARQLRATDDTEEMQYRVDSLKINEPIDDSAFRKCIVDGEQLRDHRFGSVWTCCEPDIAANATVSEIGGHRRISLVYDIVRDIFLGIFFGGGIVLSFYRRGMTRRPARRSEQRNAAQSE